MDYQALHSWEVAPTEAARLQTELSSRVRLEPLRAEPRRVAGADVSYNRFSDVIFAGFVVIDVASGAIVDRSSAVLETRFPYVPGLLSFREAPALLEAWQRLRTEPDVVFFDGQGVLHPRGLGIAAHLGLLIDRPSIGCAKSLLIGRYDGLGPDAGSSAPITWKGRTLGAALRTRNRVSPVFISPGHRITLEDAARVTLRCTGRYRIPEPTRQAHLWANELRRMGEAEVLRLAA